MIAATCIARAGRDVLAGAGVDEDADALALGLGGPALVILGGLDGDPLTGEVVHGALLGGAGSAATVPATAVRYQAFHP